ncbi:MAG TPA: hypothetical protein VFY10_08420 [Dehalococcoidia bacterium]|nr:hypothetical protein [Dehalococcoidia bacterium]
MQAALYYPYIHIRSESWLKATLLCVPAVKRIVPDTYTPEDDAAIIPYITISGPNGPLLQAVPAATSGAMAAQDRLLTALRANESKVVARYSREKSPNQDEYWVHDAKFNSELLEFLESRNLAWRSQHNRTFGQRAWYALHPKLGSAVMTTLGLSVARDEELDIVTDSGDYHEALLTSDEGAIVDALLSDAKSRVAGPLDRQQALGELVFALGGINLKAIRPEHIPGLQTTPGFHDFQDALRRAAAVVDPASSPKSYQDQVQREATAIVKAWQDTQLSLASELKSILPEQAKGVAPALVTAMLTGVGANPVALGVGVGVGLVTHAVKVGRRALKSRNQFLSKVEGQQDKLLRFQFPLGLEKR